MPSVMDEYHRWFYEQELWNKVSFLGVKTLKNILDLWLYQEIIWELKPSVIVETGAYMGGSTLFLSTIMSAASINGVVISVEIKPERIDPKVVRMPNVEIISTSSTDPLTAESIKRKRDSVSGPLFMILDTRPRKEQVLAEMINFRGVLRGGDYLVVEDSNLNGNPVMPDWGPGPMEAIKAYERQYPNDYIHDTYREAKFGTTFAPQGFLQRI
jgi:cephalosporin hydroxylase